MTVALYRINSCFRADWYPGREKTERPGIPGDFDLHFCVKGKGLIEVGDQEWTLATGDLVIVPPRVRFFVRGPVEGIVFDRLALHFEPIPSNLFGDSGDGDEERPPSLPLPRLRSGAEFRRLLAASVAYWHQGGETAKMKATLRFNEAMLSLSERSTGEDDPQVEKNRHRLDAVRRHLESRYAENLSVAELAERVGLSTNHLIRLFRRDRGQTPGDFLVSVRIERAKRLLLSSDLAMASVARSVGYGDGAEFSKAFRKRTGLSPSAWLAQARLGLRELREHSDWEGNGEI